MTKNLQTTIDTVTQLTPNEQLELIATVSLSLQKQLQPKEFAPTTAIPAGVRRALPLQQISQLKAEFWPEDATAHDINHYLEQQCKKDLLREQNEYGAT